MLMYTHNAPVDFSAFAATWQDHSHPSTLPPSPPPPPPTLPPPLSPIPGLVHAGGGQQPAYQDAVQACHTHTAGAVSRPDWCCTWQYGACCTARSIPATTGASLPLACTCCAKNLFLLHWINFSMPHLTSVCRYVCLCQPVCLSVCPSVCPSVSMSICLSVCPTDIS